jgi:hypothetical protein
MPETPTFRPLDWRDIPLLHRIRDSGLCFDSELAYTSGPHALQNALFGVFNPGRSTLTVVGRVENQALVGQILHDNSQPHARLAFIGPAEIVNDSACERLLEALAQTAGENGAHNLIAEVNEHSPAFECLREAGFAIYARQRIWRLNESGDATAPLPDHQPPRSPSWRPETSADETPIHFLYVNLVPGLVQQAEPPPHRTGRGMVYWSGGDLLGYLDIDRGPLGDWIQPYFHPAAEEPEALLGDYIARTNPRRRVPLYVCVRSYHGWLRTPLERLGFEVDSDQAVMVKRLAASVRRPALVPLPALEGTRPEPTAPFIPMEGPKPAGGAGGSP